ncbi:MAG TPA: hypothetical protein VFQ95_08795 [Rhodanobacteraceae bacterium]|nr:hypothetical protein [Rhodanobacteraceae bacterium]
MAKAAGKDPGREHRYPDQDRGVGRGGCEREGRAFRPDLGRERLHPGWNQQQGAGQFRARRQEHQRHRGAQARRGQRKHHAPQYAEWAPPKHARRLLEVRLDLFQRHAHADDGKWQIDDRVGHDQQRGRLVQGIGKTQAERDQRQRYHDAGHAARQVGGAFHDGDPALAMADREPRNRQGRERRHDARRKTVAQ